ncbi:carbohydrate binding domain-containing protein [Ruania rhizosphaerae]|uniref:carbohydrate binding domain-containing protein n=1 Tax=Ruania rhizosphaerae TaxID=1840413 RepID=UPI001358D491|nr:carbohydrate binding domain-containing protein [Ruania rhizosphaerae]
MGHSTNPRRAVSTAALVGLAATMLMPVAAVATPPTNESGIAQETSRVEEDLGPTMTGYGSASVGYTTDPDGRNIGLFVSTGSPSAFSAVDIETGERLLEYDIDGFGVQIWEFVTAPDGDVYFGATKTGEVFQYDVENNELNVIAVEPFGQTHFFGAAAGSDGRIYFGTYRDGKVISYEPSADEWRDYGSVLDGAMYVRSIDVDDEYIYAGTGTTVGVVQIDIETGAMSEIELPTAAQDEQFVQDLSVRGDYVFARMSDAVLHVYSLAQEAWIEEIPRAAGQDLSPVVTTIDSGVERREALIPMQLSDGLAFDIDTGETREISFGHRGQKRSFGLLELSAEGFPGETLVTATDEGTFYAWNPETGATSTFEPDVAPSRYLIRSLGVGPQGDIWTGGYASPPGLARTDADTGESIVYPTRTGQPEEIVAHGDYLVAGMYTRARLHAYDTTQSWSWGSNPRTDIRLGEEQDRPLALASAGDVVAVGTMPTYGTLGGALSLFDPESGDVDVFRNVVNDQTVLSLAYRGGLIYGGTGIWGGIGVEPSTTEGHLFVFDPATSEVVYSGVPVPGAENVSALTFDNDGNLWGFTANELFKFDPTTREVVLTERYFDFDDSSIYATGRELFWHEGKLVGSSNNQLFEIDPETLEMTVLFDDAYGLAIDRNGSYYYARQANLYRWVEPELVCSQTLTDTVNGGLTVAAGDVACLEGARVNGGITVGVGGALLVDDSSIRGGVSTTDARSVQIRDSEIRGAVTVTGTQDETVLSGNTVRGSLECSENSSQPHHEGSLNTVTGSAGGQCAVLVPVEDDSPNLLVNAGFEEGADVTDIPGWSLRWPASAHYVSLTDERSSDGIRSLHVRDTSTSGGGGLVSDSVPVEAGATYEFSFDQYRIDGRLAPTIFFDDADGDVVDQSYELVEPTLDTWERTDLRFEVPEGAVAARVMIYSSSGIVGESFVDNVYFGVPGGLGDG